MAPSRQSKTCTICGKRSARMSGHLRDHRSGRIDSRGKRVERTTTPKRPRKLTRAPETRERAPRARRSVARELTHLDGAGNARMVDVGAKAESERRAVARGKLALSTATVALVRGGRTPKGDVLAAARIAGIMAAKRTSELIPLCHPIALTHLAVELRVDDDGITIEATAATTGKTGVEMEALTAVAVAGLTLYDMLKSVERGARLGDVRLVEKHGGRSGDVRLE